MPDCTDGEPRTFNDRPDDLSQPQIIGDPPFVPSHSAVGRPSVSHVPVSATLDDEAPTVDTFMPGLQDMFVFLEPHIESVTTSPQAEAM